MAEGLKETRLKETFWREPACGSSTGDVGAFHLKLQVENCSLKLVCGSLAREVAVLCLKLQVLIHSLRKRHGRFLPKDCDCLHRISD